jgi:SNF family Na+-dependent transporter
MAHERGVTVPEVTKSGIGLAFVVFPDAVSLMPIPHLFAVVLFITMFTLGIDSAFGLVESVNSVVHDQFHRIPLPIVALIVCVAGFICGIPFTLTNGFFLMDIVDHFISDYCLILIGICECVIIGYFVATVPLKQKIQETKELIVEYGVTKRIQVWMYFKLFLLHSADEYREKITAVSSKAFGRHVGHVWSILIKFCIPILLGGIWLSQIITECIKPYSTFDDGSFDLTSLIIGLFIVIGCILTILIFVLVPGKNRQEKHEANVLNEIINEFETS